MIYAVYQLEDGRLVSTTTDQTKVAVKSVLDARGYGVAKRPDSEADGIWNPATLAFDATPAQTEVLIQPDVFIDQFTATETKRVYDSTDPVLYKFVRRLQVRRSPLDLVGDTVTQGLQYIAHLGLFDDQNGVADAPTTRPAAIQAYRP